ncbi:corticotropin-releasing factor-binding protein-like [Styela clava]
MTTITKLPGATLLILALINVCVVNGVIESNSTEDNMPRRFLECVDMIRTPGFWTFEQTEVESDMCAVYLIADPDEIIIVTITDLEVDCLGGEFVEVFDGWLSGGQVMPSEYDHEKMMHERLAQACNDGESLQSLTMKTSQNFALVQLWLEVGKRLTLKFDKVKTDSPCNAISPSAYGQYIMRYAGNEMRNCTFSVFYPSRVTLSSLNIGVTADTQNERSINSMSKVPNEGSLSQNGNFDGYSMSRTDKDEGNTIDYELLKENGNTLYDKLFVLSGSHMQFNDNLIATHHGPKQDNGCHVYNLTDNHSAVRMLSSGQHQNEVTITYSRLQIEFP